MLVRWFFLSLLAVLTACSAQTASFIPKEGNTPEGYSEQKLGDNLYRVRYETYRNVPEEEVEKLALRRAAELTRQSGYQEFEVVNRRQGLNNETEWVQDTARFGDEGGGMGTVALPGHTRAFHIRYVELVVRMVTQADS